MQRRCTPPAVRAGLITRVVADQDTARIAQDTGRATRGWGAEDDRRLIAAKATSCIVITLITMLGAGR
jgi:hypothetical protein